MCCIERWAEVESDDTSCSSRELSDSDETGFEGSKSAFLY
ncbi:unnamed protein product [Onchocerca flexuosa]|nr:unnamed protein product [Onchocerca flexuosa]